MSAFVLNKKYELALPTSYVDVDNEEMEYVDGGYEIKVNPAMVKRDYCVGVATGLCQKGIISFWNIYIIAKEIRGHAVAFYGLSGLASLGISNSTLNQMRKQANPISIRDGFDHRPKIVAACEAIWLLPG